MPDRLGMADMAKTFCAIWLIVLKQVTPLGVCWLPDGCSNVSELILFWIPAIPAIQMAKTRLIKKLLKNSLFETLAAVGGSSLALNILIRM